MSVGRSRTPHRDALEKAVRYAEEAEACDAAQHYEDRDVRLRFASVWATIALASRPLAPEGTGLRRTTTPKEI
ncbi:hypothetical protein SEA_ARACELI_61 [Streptomyces phage Araceli]|nr:hypothetical protein SEA_HENOCCUS_62 [Streptomyces phage Henoccus]AWY07380.1 hypothetical protein SEA_JACKIEB_62 [Streptomyces phage JackieB]QFG07875.1 hypothetical protein SEA_ARACELI_61 [Streptomyces phage Araceli]